MTKRRIYLSLIALAVMLTVVLSGCSFILPDSGTTDGTHITEVPANVVIAGEKIPAYKSDGYYVVNNNKPLFTDDEITDKGFYRYTDLDELGRAGMAVGCIGPETLPDDEREDINHITPSGWKYNGKSNNNRYDASTGVNSYIYNRAHLLANQLVSDDVDERNFITGTCGMNQKQMVKFENMVADYVKETDGHVMYRVTPYFEGKNLICSGVLMEGYSVEDEGESVEFCVFIYNVQPNIYINYLTGENCLLSEAPSTPDNGGDNCLHKSTEIKNSTSSDCGNDGYSGDTYCKDCGEKLGGGTTLPANGEHSFGEWVLNTDGTKETRECSVCGASEDRDRVCTHESTEIKNSSSADCGNDGYSGDTYCKVCGEKLGDGSALPATGEHSFGEWVLNTDGTKETRECSVCGKDEERDYVAPDDIVKVPENVVIGGQKIPPYSSSAYFTVNGGTPFFTNAEITTVGFYRYTELDALGRAGVAVGCIGPETLPDDAREDIGHIYPSGWKYNGKSNNNSYPASTGVNGTIYNRTHLLAHQLVSGDVDKRNFITGTCLLNQGQMVKFENMVADYVKETDGHVMYRVTPYFEGENLICSGVLIEGYSVEDKGASVKFCVFLYNVQPGIRINYLTGENELEGANDGDNESDGSSYTVVDTPTAGVAYKMIGEYTAGIRYFNGKISSGMQTTTDIAEAVDVYLESTGTDGQYYLYYYVNGVKTYIVMSGNKTTSMKASTTPSTYWTIDANTGAFVSSYNTNNSLGNRGLATDASREDIRAYYEKDSKYKPVKFAIAK